MNRRVALAALGGAAAAAVLPLLPLKSLAGRPRYRHQRGSIQEFPPKSESFYLNRRSGYIHYARLQHRDPTVSRPTLKNYEILSFDDLIKRLQKQKAEYEAEENVGPKPKGPFLDVSNPAGAIEQIVLGRVRQAHYSEARKFLWELLSTDKVDYGLSEIKRSQRLYDLLAVLTVRFGNQQDYVAFLEMVSSTSLSLSDQAGWSERVNKWCDQYSNWSKKWKATRKHKWAGLLM